MYKLLILSRLTDEYYQLLREANLPELELVPTYSPEEAILRGGDCKLAFGEPNRLCQVIQRLTGLQWVQSTWAGVEPLLNPALRRNYILTNARGVYGMPMSEYVFGYLLERERHIIQRYLAQQAGRWDETMHGVLRGKQIGLLGVGSIGADLARTAKHFGMRVKGFTRASESCPEVDIYFHPPEKLAFAEGLDYLVCVLPQLSSTTQLVDRALLDQLPPRAVVINVGRSSVIDETALVEALQSGRLAGAILDVFKEEPLPAEHVFWRTPNLLITSHTAAMMIPADVVEVFFKNYRRMLRGEALNFQVDFELGY